MITKKQKLSVMYFLSRAFFLGVGYSLLFDKVGKDAWISVILGTLIGVLVAYLISKVLKYKKDKTLKEVFKDMKWLGIILKIIYFAFLLFLLYECLFIIQTMATSFFLINSPTLFVAITGVFLVIMTIKENDTTLFKVSESLIALAVITVIVTVLILIPYGETEAFLPVLTTSPKMIGLGALYYAAISTGPLLLTLDYKSDGKGIIKTYLLTSLILLIICLTIIAVLGPELITIYRFPEYMVLKRIKILDFIEKVENIISIIWILDAFMLLATTTQNIKNLLPQKGGKIISSGVLIVMMLITSVYFGSNYILELEIYYLVPLILGIAIVAILLPLYIFSLIKYRKKKG